MSSPSQTRTLLTAALGIPLLFTATVALQMRIDAHAQTEQRSDALLLSSPSAVKKLSLGYDALLADIYWTRVVQYYGERIGVRGAQFDLLWPLLDITTTLDPKLIVAYRFGAIFLSEPGGVGAGRTDLAVQLVKRGIAANPDQWQLYSDLGFLYYWRMKDFPDSAAAYLEGSKSPACASVSKNDGRQSGGTRWIDRNIPHDLVGPLSVDEGPVSAVARGSNATPAQGPRR